MYLRIYNIILPDLLVEYICRSGGWLADIVLFGKGLSVECRIRAFMFHLKFGYNARDIGRRVIISKPQHLVLHKGASVRHGVVVMCGAAGVEIGERTHISHNSVLAASGGLTVGRDCGISSGVIIYTVDHDHTQGLPLAECPVRASAVRIGNGVHIGANVTILPGVDVGDDSIIGAGAVVTKSVNANSVVAGVPAREI